VFSTKEFQDWAKSNVVLFCSMMTRIEGRKDDDLLRTYGFRGFPSFAVLDHEGTAVTKKVDRSVEGVKKAVTASTAVMQMRAKMEAGEEIDKAEYFFARMMLGALSYEKAEEELAELENLSDEQAEKADRMMLDLKLQGLMNRQRGMRRASPDQRQAMTKEIEDTVYKAYKNGLMPEKGANSHLFFMGNLATAAEKAGDGKAFLVAYPHVRPMVKSNLDRYVGLLESPRFKNNPNAIQQITQIVERFKKQLADMDAKAEQFKDAK
jgi:hypothetical protein